MNDLQGNLDMSNSSFPEASPRHLYHVFSLEVSHTSLESSAKSKASLQTFYHGSGLGFSAFYY